LAKVFSTRQEVWLRARKVRAAAAAGLAAGVLVGCGGGSDDKPKAIPGKTVSGETESGMKLKIDTFVSPSQDPEVKKLEAWRSAAHYPVVDYHRVTADNSAGAVADSGRIVRFAADANALASGKGVEARFTCDVLEFEWLPTSEAKSGDWNALRKQLCENGPPKQGGIPPGSRKVYYLVTDRDFAARGIRTMKVFGPRDAEFK
jgi:hypothetical protein